MDDRRKYLYQGLVGVAALLMTALSGIPAVSAQDLPPDGIVIVPRGIGTPDNPDVAFPDNGFALGGQKYRRPGAKPIYGWPLNVDYYPLPDFYCLKEGTIFNDQTCTLEWRWTNTSDSAITTARFEIEASGAPGSRITSSNVERIQPGETGGARISLEFNRNPSFYEETLRVTANNGESFEVDLSFEVKATSPSHPTGAGTVLTGGKLSVFWSAPEFDGGSDINGYVVEMIRPKPYDGTVDTYRTDTKMWWTERVEACNFRGRPELLICDMPNNSYPKIEAGEYIIAIQALSVLNSEPDRHLDVLFLDPITLPALGADRPPPLTTPPLKVPPTTTSTAPVPASTTTPTTTTPTSTSTPTRTTPVPPVVEEVVQVDFYSEASNIASLVEAYDYSNSLDAPVLRLYQAYFNRRPDLGGAKYWLGIRRQGYDLGQIAGFMAGSDEFRNAYFGTTNAAYVAKVYTNVLGRAYDQAGYDYWLDLLNTNQTNRVTTVFYITANKEFINAYPFTNDHPDLTITSCDSRAETVVIRNNGDATVNLAGWKLNDRGPQFVLGDIGKLLAELAPGGSVEFRSGRTPALPSQLESFIWSDRDIWNNTGDTAYLVSSEGRTESQLDCQ